MYVTSVLILFLFLISCTNSNGPDEKNSLSFPLEVGNKWVYQRYFTYDDSLRDDSVRLIYTEVSAVIDSLSSNLVYEFKENNDEGEGLTYSYYEDRNDGLYYFATASGGQHLLVKSLSLKKTIDLRENPILIAPYNFEDNFYWVYDRTSDFVTNKIKYLKREYVGRENVDTDAGTFNCFTFKSTGYADDIIYHYYYPDIGLVLKKRINEKIDIPDKDGTIIKTVTITDNLKLVSFKDR